MKKFIASPLNWIAWYAIKFCQMDKKKMSALHAFEIINNIRKTMRGVNAC